MKILEKICRSMCRILINGFSWLLKILEDIGKSICWNIVTVFLGLLQVITLLIFKAVGFVSWDTGKIFKDCGILFFCSALVSTSVVEYFFNDYRYPKLVELVFFYILPTTLLVFTCILYGAIIMAESLGIDVSETSIFTCLSLKFTLKSITLIFFGISGLYSIIFNTLKFHSWR